MNKNIFVNRLVELRKEMKLTQAELGEAIGGNYYLINNIERGRGATKPDYIILLADFFDVSLDYLYGRTDDRRNPCVPKSA